MIPKTIHYCWFGRNPLPKSAKKCIKSWKKYCPNYEIKEWNEDNFDVNSCDYIKEAYECKKYAFVSDYARFYILYHYGGLYFDTDVEIIKPIDDLVAKGAFMGCEVDGAIDDTGRTCIYVAPGLGLAAPAGLTVYKEILEHYERSHFIDKNNQMNTKTVVVRTTEILRKHGLEYRTGIQTVGGIKIYPKEYFNPLNDITGKLEITNNTRSIHWYSKTWLSNRDRIKSKLTRPFHRVFGEDCFKWLKKS